MTREEAKEYLIDLSYKLGTTAVEYLTYKDGEKIRKAIEVLMLETEDIKLLSLSQPEISYIISETLHECGIYGEEETIKLIGTLKRIGRDDLIPPCAR